jgi:membrane-bound lytic murein transglycosylase D
MNGIRSVHRLRAGQALIIPVPEGAAPPVVAELERAPAPARKTAFHKTYAAAPAAKGARKMNYVIQSGDTLWAVSQAYGVSVQQLKAWNGIRNHYYLKPGDSITLYTTQPKAVVASAVPAAPAKSPTSPVKGAAKISTSGKKPQGRATTYTVRNGDNLWTIAHHYRLQPEDILAWNSLDHDHVLHPGDRLQLFLPGKR